MPERQPMTLFSMTTRAMSAQMVRMNAATSNLANATDLACETLFRSRRRLWLPPARIRGRRLRSESSCQLEIWHCQCYR